MGRHGPIARARSGDVSGLLARGGQRSAAIRHYEDFAKLLINELGQEPGEEARRVYDSVLAGRDPTHGARAAREPGKTATWPRGPAFPGLLATKLAVPLFRPGKVSRGRLSCLIEEGMDKGMVLVSAPAGFGKSTILAEWASGAGLPIAWLSLDSGDNNLRGVIAVSRAFIFDLAGDTAQPVELARTADRLLSPTDHHNRALIPYIIGRAARYQGELDKAESVYADFLRRGREAESIWPIAGAVYETLQIYRLQGRLLDALGLIEDFEAEADRFRARGTGPVAKTFALKAALLRETGRLAEARSVAEEAVRQVDSWGLPSDICVSHQYLARVLHSCGHLERAMEELESFYDLPRRALVYASLYPAFEADRVRTWLALGELEPARAWAAEVRPDKDPLLVNREIERIVLARVRLAADGSAEESRRAAVLLDRLAYEARDGNRFGPLVEILVLQAEAALRLGDKDEGRRFLQEALRLGKPAGFAQTFMELGPELAELL